MYTQTLSLASRLSAAAAVLDGMKCIRRGEDCDGGHGDDGVDDMATKYMLILMCMCIGALQRVYLKCSACARVHKESASATRAIGAAASALLECV